MSVGALWLWVILVLRADGSTSGHYYTRIPISVASHPLMCSPLNQYNSDGCNKKNGVMSEENRRRLSYKHHRLPRVEDSVGDYCISWLKTMASTSWISRNNSAAPNSTRECVQEQNSTFAVNIVKEALGEKLDLSKDTIYRTLSSCVGEVLANCEPPMVQLVNRLDLTRGIGYDKFAALADELFEAENGFIILWERIVTLFAFTWVLSKQLQTDQIDSSNNISKILASYLNDKITPWILQQGGWVGSFVCFWNPFIVIIVLFVLI